MGEGWLKWCPADRSSIPRRVSARRGTQYPLPMLHSDSTSVLFHPSVHPTTTPIHPLPHPMVSSAVRSRVPTPYKRSIARRGIGRIRETEEYRRRVRLLRESVQLAYVRSWCFHGEGWRGEGRDRGRGRLSMATCGSSQTRGSYWSGDVAREGGRWRA